MPIYEYKCPACNAAFEELVRSPAAARKVVCPQCGHHEVQRQFSTFATHANADRDTRATGPCGQCGGLEGGCPMARGDE